MHCKLHWTPTPSAAYMDVSRPLNRYPTGRNAASARAVRAEVITHLDEYLEKFTNKLVENGMTVHRARDEAEAL